MIRPDANAPAGASPGAPVLEVTDLQVTFPGSSENGDIHAVRGLTYGLRRGEVLGVVGESGSGKTVSALAVIGLLPETARARGSVRLHGAQLLGRSDRRMARERGRTISMVFQDPLAGLTPIHPVGTQIAEAVAIHHPTLGKRAVRDRAVALLRRVGVPDAEERYTAFPHEISGGMRQRVMIAMAIANEPDVILCDEPTAALDVTVQAQILHLLTTVRRETGAAILLISHDLGVVAGLAHRALVMYAGAAVEAGSTADIYHRACTPYTLGLLGVVPRLDPPRDGPPVTIAGAPPPPEARPPGCSFAPRCPIAVPECSATEPPLRPVGSTGHVAACHRAEEIVANGWGATDIHPTVPPPSGAPPSRRDDRATVLEVHGLVKHYPLTTGRVFERRTGTVHAVDGVTFDIKERESLGLVGESGCGKSTVLTRILDLTTPERGRVVVVGRDTASLSVSERLAVRRDLQVVFQDPTSSLDPRMSVTDIVAEPLRTHRHPRAASRARVDEVLRLVGLDPATASRFPSELSGGQCQRVAIARALALQPRLLLLDEPVSALDVSVQAGVLSLLERLKAELGLSYLIVAHDLAVVRRVVDRVAVMHMGGIVELGSADAVYTSPAHPYTQALLSAVPIPDPERERRRAPVVLNGDPPSPISPPAGCGFRDRCRRFPLLSASERDLCRRSPPRLAATARPDHSVACHHADLDT